MDLDDTPEHVWQPLVYFTHIIIYLCEMFQFLRVGALEFHENFARKQSVPWRDSEIHATGNNRWRLGRVSELMNE